MSKFLMSSYSRRHPRRYLHITLREPRHRPIETRQQQVIHATPPRKGRSRRGRNVDGDDSSRTAKSDVRAGVIENGRRKWERSNLQRRGISRQINRQYLLRPVCDDLRRQPRERLQVGRPLLDAQIEGKCLT